MDTQDAYQELGLQPSASDAQLKATWRRLVAAWHPDRNPAADALHRMQLINKAYQHIRQLRDGGGTDATDSPPTRPPEAEAHSAAESSSAHGNGNGNASGPDTEQPQPDPANNSTAGNNAGNGADTEGHTSADATHPHPVRKVSLSMEEAILGCTRSLRGHYTHACTACAGTGQRVLAQACGTCRGSGAIRKPTLFGWLWNEEGCPQCGGDGRQRQDCDTCDSTGECSVPYHRRVRFPAGMRSGDVLSVPPARHGDVHFGLELQLDIEPHPFFTLDAQGVLRCEMPVNGYAWMTGRWVEVPTPDGLQHMRLSRDALVYRLGGKGFPNGPRGPRGDFIVKVQPVFPPLADPEQEALLDQLIAQTSQAAEADDAQPLGQWQRKLKSWKAK